MASLTVKVVVAGAAGTGLTVKAYPQSDFVNNPQRTQAAPNSAPDATGTTDGTGTVVLTVNSVAYQVLVVDARGVNNWFPVGGSYIGSTYYAIIPWSTPTSTTKTVSIGGDTPGGPQVRSPWSQRQHIHEVPSAGVTQIVAGTDITISPTSGEGVVTINALVGDGMHFQGSSPSTFTLSQNIDNVLQVVGSVNGTGTIYTPSNLATGSFTFVNSGASAATLTCRLEYSANGGITWNDVVTATKTLPAGATDVVTLIGPAAANDSAHPGSLEFQFTANPLSAPSVAVQQGSLFVVGIVT